MIKALILAIILQESGFNPKAVSPVGAKGLMQLMPIAVKQVMQDKGYTKVPDLFDPVQNYHYGTQYLGYCARRFKTLNKTLTCYNAGPGWVYWHWVKGKPLPKETKDYIIKVRKYRKEIYEGTIIISEYCTRYQLPKWICRRKETQ